MLHFGSEFLFYICIDLLCESKETCKKTSVVFLGIMVVPHPTTVVGMCSPFTVFVFDHPTFPACYTGILPSHSDWFLFLFFLTFGWG